MTDDRRPMDELVLRAIWDRSEGTYAFMPWVSKDGWMEGQGILADPNYGVLPNRQSADQYFTPLLYTDMKRRRENVGRPGVIFADLDGAEWIDTAQRLEMMPSVVVTSGTPGHSHGYWFLDRTLSLEEWEPRARGWSRVLKADPGGWDSTQVLRVPGSLNHKHKPPKPVTLVYFDPEVTYAPSQFPELAVTLVTPGDSPKPNEFERSLAAEGLSPSARYFVYMTKEQFLASGIRDRSRFAWGIYKELFKLGYKAEDIFQLCYPAPWNKHDRQNLWREIKKAEQRPTGERQ